MIYLEKTNKQTKAPFNIRLIHFSYNVNISGVVFVPIHYINTFYFKLLSSSKDPLSSCLINKDTLNPSTEIIALQYAYNMTSFCTV